MEISLALLSGRAGEKSSMKGTTLLGAAQLAA